jgi:hypothetical protein
MGDRVWRFLARMRGYPARDRPSAPAAETRGLYDPDVAARDHLRKNGPLVGWLVGLLVLGAVVYAGTDDPRIRHTSALNAVFDARWLVAGARRLALVAVVYLLLSIGVRVQKGQWVRSAGSVDTDASPAQALADDREDLQHQLVEAKATIDDLTERLGRSLAVREASLATMKTSRGRGHPAPDPGEEVSDGDDR